MWITSLEQLADLVRDQRKRLKMSQAELAAQTGNVSRQWIVGLEAGRTNPDFKTLVRLFEVLRLKADISQGDLAQLSAGDPDLDDVLDRLKK